MGLTAFIPTWNPEQKSKPSATSTFNIPCSMFDIPVGLPAVIPKGNPEQKSKPSLTHRVIGFLFPVPYEN